MKRTRNNLWLGALSALGIVITAPLASASSHKEAPVISTDPQADNCDLYAWVSADNLNLNIVGTWIPLEEPGGGPNYNKLSDDVLYEFHIARGVGVLDDFATYQFKFSTVAIPYKAPAPANDPFAGNGDQFFAQITPYFVQTYTVTRIAADGTSAVVASGAQAAPPNIGPQTSGSAYTNAAYAGGGSGVYDTAFQAKFIKATAEAGGAKGQVFAGPVDDPFFTDISAIFDLANLRPLAGKAGVDNLAGYNTHAIVLQVPLTTLIDTTGGKTAHDDANLLGIWASSSRHKVSVMRYDGTNEGIGPWVQVSRLGLPLINEAVIGIQDKDKWNRYVPKDDVAYFAPYFLNPVLVRDANALGLYGTGKLLGNNFAAESTGRTDILDIVQLKAQGHTVAIAAGTTGDVLRLDTSLPSGFPNGRKLADPVTDVLIDVILTGNPVKPIPSPTGVSANDVAFNAAFPYVALPWEGFSHGHNVK